MMLEAARSRTYQEYRRSHLVQDHVGRDLSENIADEEQT